MTDTELDPQLAADVYDAVCTAGDIDTAQARGVALIVERTGWNPAEARKYLNSMVARAAVERAGAGPVSFKALIADATAELASEGSGR